jgi:hypothetical protein
MEIARRGLKNHKFQRNRARFGALVSYIGRKKKKAGYEVAFDDIQSDNSGSLVANVLR